MRGWVDQDRYLVSQSGRVDPWGPTRLTGSINQPQRGDFIGPQEDDDDFLLDADFLTSFFFEPDVLAISHHLLSPRLLKSYFAVGWSVKLKINRTQWKCRDLIRTGGDRG